MRDKLAKFLKKLRSWRSKKSQIDPSLQVIKQLFSGRKIQTMFDIGANEGSFTQEALDVLSPGSIFSFEPIQQHFEKLRSSLPKTSVVTPLCMAMGSTVGTLEFHINEDIGYNHSLLSTDPRSDGWATVKHVEVQKVQCGTVDSFCQEHGIEHLDVLKVDAEGADILVLQGAERMLRQHAIGLVYVEVLLKPLFDGQGSLRQFLELMESHGYVFFNIFDVRTNALRQLTLANAMFVLPELLDQAMREIQKK